MIAQKPLRDAAIERTRSHIHRLSIGHRPPVEGAYRQAVFTSGYIRDEARRLAQIQLMESE